MRTVKDKLYEFMKFHDNKEAAIHFGVSVRTISRWLSEYGLSYYNLRHWNKPKELSDLQRDVLIGTLLGGASILKDGRYKYRGKHVKEIHEIMKPFSCNIRDDYFVTIRSPLFKKERKNWYVDRKKTVPEISLNSRICYYWSLSGSNNSKTRSFVLRRGLNEVRLAEMLRKLGIESRNMRILSRSYFDWMELIGVKCEAERARVGWGRGKLNYWKSNEIRDLYQTGKYTQKQLAFSYGVTPKTIWRVVNNLVYCKISHRFSGSADVHITFKA